ncbi:MAG: PIN domain-containing protein [Chloroflexota bacterium]|nr:PIN domain-containing protein [Chloroflexota bacterium]
MRLLDTNVIIRYLTGDDPAKAADCRELLQRAARGEEQIRLCEAHLTEVVYILSARAHYGLGHEEIRQRLILIINLRGLKLPRKKLYRRALDVYALYAALDFEDALAVAYMEADGLAELYSYDRDFDCIPTITRIEP